ncbi:ATP-binding protein [Massilia endophytica]|uniref:ATP-binding protein n=1 Tax=Massilia endophytica TaxID=2899220 RepID=UPI001E61D295|nr:ATP-binding protein [Massilia endophytica]UGQ48230.1 ATP-binding protein [Massilia endophytica]
MIFSPGPDTSNASSPGLDRSAPAAHDAPRQDQAPLQTVLDSITDGLAMVAPDWTIRYMNGPAHDMLCEDRCQDVAGADLWQAIPPLRGTVFEAQARLAMERQQPCNFELYYLPRQRWLEVRAYPSAEGLSFALADIHQRKQQERALRENSNRLQVAMAAGRLGDWSWDAASGLVMLGNRAADLFDLPADTPVSWSTLQDRMVTEDREPARHALLEAFARRKDFSIECRIERPAGQRRWLSIVGHGNYDDADQLLSITGMVQEITERKAAEDALRHSEEQLRALADSIPQLAWIAQADGAMIWYNRRWFEYTGTTEDDMLGDGWQQVYDPACIPPMVAHWQQAIASGQPFEMEFPIRGADGQYRWFLTRANPVRNPEGRMVRWFGTSTDVDQVKRAQEALRDETNILELLNSTGNALARHRDLQPLLQEVTDAATRISGARFGAFYYNHHDGGPLTLYTLAGRPMSDYGDLDRERAGPLLGASLSGESITRCDDLAVHPECAPDSMLNQLRGMRSFLAAPVISRSGDVTGTLLFGHPEPNMFTERTERILAGIAAQAAIAIDNARLNEAARLAAEERIALLISERSAREEAERSSQMKDEFLATLSHELRTPLTAILGWSQVLRRGGRGEADLNKGLQTIERNARAQAQLIEDLLDMSRIMSGKVLLDLQSVQPAAVVDAAIDSVRPAAAARNIGIERDFAPTGLVAADPGRLQQIVWNLLTNAIKFTQQDGRVRIAIRESAGQVEIAVSDTGIGIGAEFLGHVFERFRQADASSTRRHGGLGLGLSIVKHLVEQHGGTVGVESAGEGQGASFTVRLPLATASVLARSQPAAPRHLPPRRAPQEVGAQDLHGLRVLVVDDEPDTRDLIKRVLSDCNARVEVAGGAAEALQLMPAVQPELIVSDIGMPEMDGFELLARIRALPAHLGGRTPAIALTAFARAEDRERALQAGFASHIAKPVEPAELITSVAFAATQGQHG